MKLGFTGTRRGMTKIQIDKFKQYLDGNPITEFHHGSCKGADTEAHDIVKFIGIKIVLHPPLIKTQMTKRCLVESDVCLEPKEYLERNHDIVNETDILVGMPWQNKEPESKRAGGTWATIRYARKNNKKYIIIFPNGIIKRSI